MPEQNDTPPKRLVKNPETFRERALKAVEAEGGKPTRKARTRSAIGRLFRPLSPAKRAVAKLFTKPPFKWFAKPFRWIGLVIVPVYVRNSWQELRLVTWPSGKQSRQLTFAVLAFAVVFGCTVALVDYGLDKLFRDILLK